MFIGLEVKATIDGEYKFETNISYISFSLSIVAVIYLIWMISLYNF